MRAVVQGPVVAQGAKYQMSVVWAVSTRNKGKTEHHLNVLSEPGSKMGTSQNW